LNIIPRKKITAVIFGLLAVAALGFLLSQPRSTNYKFDNTLAINDEIQRATLNALTSKDADGDGLKDWEEALWGTDSNNPDTDGDGVKDGDEIDANRNPLIVGPNDNLDEEFYKQKEANDKEISTENLTATEQFAQDLFNKYMSLRTSQSYIDDAAKNSLITSSIDSALNANFNERYSVSDLNSVKNNNNAQLRKYANNAVLAIRQYSQDLTQDELIVFERALREENQDDVEYIGKLADTYGTIAGNLVNIEVTDKLALIHLDIINSYSILSDALKDMSVVLDDPIRGMNGFSTYIAITEAQEELFREIRDSLINNGVVLEPGEPGYAWYMI
jgi:hypothetical protein